MALFVSFRFGISIEQTASTEMDWYVLFIFEMVDARIRSTLEFVLLVNVLFCFSVQSISSYDSLFRCFSFLFSMHFGT